MLIASDKDIEKTFDKMFYYHYQFGPLHVYSKTPLSKQDKEAYQKQIDEELAEVTDQFTNEIDKRIIKRLINSGSWKIVDILER